MSREWMVNAPNGSHVNIDGVGKLNHGQHIKNEKIVNRFPHIFVEIFTDTGPALMEEPAPVAEIINEKPAEVPVLEEIPAPEVVEKTAKEPVIEEKAAPKKKSRKKMK